MSNSKKIRSRIDKLFTDIREDGTVKDSAGEVPEKPISAPPAASKHVITPASAISAAPTVTPAPTVTQAPVGLSTSFGPAQPARVNPPEKETLQLVTPQVRTNLAVSEPLAKSQSGLLATPFQMGSEWQMLQLESSKQQQWLEEDQNLVKQVADQLGLALQNAYLFEETQKTAQLLASVAEIATSISSILDIQTLLDTTVNLTQRRFGLYHAHIFLLENNEQTLSIKACGWDNPAAHGKAHELRDIDIHAPVSIVARAARDKNPVVDNNVHDDVNWLPNPMLPNVQAEMAIPIISGTQVLGVLNTHSDQLNYFSNADLSVMTTLAAHIGSAIQNARLFEETQRRTRELATLNNVVRSVSEQVGLRKVLEAAYNEINKLVHIDAFFVALHDEKNGMVELPFVMDDGKFYNEESRPINPETYTGKTILYGKTIIEYLDPDQDQERSGETFIGKSKTAGSLLFVPLKLGQTTIGCISIQSYTLKTYLPEDVSLIESISNQLSAAILNARLYNQMQANEENFRNLVENAPEAIIVIDVANNTLIEPNSNACKLLGLTAQELSRVGPMDLSPEFQPDQRPSMESLSEKVQAALNGASPIFEWQVKNARGELIPCEIHFSHLPGDRPLVRATMIDITERKAAEEEVLKFKMGIERAGDAVFMTDRSGKIIYVNPAFTTVYGYLPEDAIGNTPRIIKSGIMNKENYEQFWGSLLTKQTVSGELINRRKDGSFINIVGTNSPIVDAEGNIQGFLAVHHDITAAKKAEEEVAKFKMGIERSGDAVFMTDVEGKITYINPAFTTVYGYSPEEAIGNTPRIIKSGVLKQETYEQFWGSLLSKNTVSGELINRNKNGKIVNIVGTNSPILDANGKIQGFMAVHHDNTATKVAEHVLQENDEKLRRQNEYLSAAAEVSRLVTSTLELDPLFNRAVDLIRSSFGYYFVSFFTLDESGTNAVLRQGTGNVGDEMRARKHSLAVGSRSIIGSVTATGKTLVVNDTAIDPTHRPNPLLPATRAEAGIPLKVGSRILGALDIQSTEINAFLAEDIAILETLADQIAVALDNANSYQLAQKAFSEMQELDRIKSQFLANMSHELRTPLNSIIGFSRVILKGIDGPVSSQQQQDLTAIYNSGHHLLGLINDILDLSKIDAGKMELYLEELNISDTISSVMSTGMGLLKDKPVKLISKVPADLPTVRADPMRIRQVLINLISNAAKFTDEGSVTVSAEVQPAENGKLEMLINVTDTGPGIAKEDQSKLFQAFSQVDSSPTRKTGGTGLGLSICQRLIDLHGGTIGVHSEIGQGSTFYFTLSLYAQPSIEHRDGNKNVVLCVDDDPKIVTLYERYLQPEGYDVVPVMNPVNACEVAKRIKPYAITLDIMMPGVDGWAVLEQLKSDPETRSIPVIICSIVAEEEKGFKLGASDYLVKPIMQDDMLIALNRLNNDGDIKNVLIVDDSEDDLRLMEKILQENSEFHPILAKGGEEGWQIIINEHPQAILLDLFMPEVDGFAILERLRSDPELNQIPVVVISGVDLDPEQRQKLEGYGKQMLIKGMLEEKELFESIEKSLKRFKAPL